MINVAIIGTGLMGKHHVRIYSELNNVKISAISDLDENSGRDLAKRYNCKYYKDFKEMLDKETIDAISIAVPTSYHKDVAVYCAEKRKHILLEKPISDTVHNAEEIINTCKKNNVLLLIGHIERFNPAVIELKKQINSGKFGEITSIVSKRVGLFPSRIKDTNVIIDLAVHDIDIFNYFIGKRPTKICHNVGNALIKDRIDYGNILLKYGNTSCFVEVNWITPIKIRTLSVTGTKGYAELDYIKQDLIIYETNLEKEFNTFGEFIIKFSDSIHTKMNINKSEPLKNELIHFINCIEGKTKPIVKGEDGLEALKSCLKIIGDKH